MDDYDNILVSQGGKCAICRTKDRVQDGHYGAHKTFPVDHDHVTGKVRGVLCDSCNRGLGLLKDNISVLRAAIRYLMKHKELYAAVQAKAAAKARPHVSRAVSKSH